MTLARKNSHLAQAIDVDYSAIGDSLTIPSSGNVTITNSLAISSQTVSTIVGFDENQKLISLPTSTYPSFTELSYLKGVTSSLQTQLNAKSSSTHTHGNITNDGKIGSNADQIVVTTTDGVLTAVNASVARSTLGVQPTNDPDFTGEISLVRAAYPNIALQQTGSTGVGQIAMSGDEFQIRQTQAYAMAFFTNNQSRFTISSTGTATFAGQIVGQAGMAITGTASFGNSITVDTTLSSWSTGAGVIQTTNYSSLAAFNDPSVHLTLNAYYNGANWVYLSSAAASNYYQMGGEHIWRGAASGTAGTNVSWTTRLTISSNGTATFAGQVLVTAGSVSACSVAPIGDPNTGLVFPSADVVTLVTNGSERMRIASNGDTQIGGSNVVGLRYFDVRNTDSTLNSGSIIRLITRNAANTTDTSVDLLKYNNGLFAIVNNDSGPIVLNTGGYERVRVDASGNVGIGTNNPQHLLHVGSSVNYAYSVPSSNAYGWVSGTVKTNVDALRNAIMGTSVSGGTSNLILQGEAPYGVIAAGTGAAISIAGTSNGNDGALRFYTSASGAPTERVRVDASGNVGIGLATPQVKLHCFTSSDGAQAVFSGAQTANEQTILFRNAFYTNNSSAGIAAIGWIDTGASGGILTLKTTTNGGGASGTPTERMRIDASGNVGIGTAPLEKLHVVRSGSGVIANFSDGATQTLHIGVVASAGMYIDNPNGGYIYLRISGNNRLQLGADGSLTCSEVYADTVGATNRDLYIDDTGKLGYVSSIRESKTDIESLNDVSWLSSLNPVSYFYRKRDNDGNYTQEPDGIKDYGLIAEEVEEIAPELCFYDMVDNEPQLRGVTYSKLITPMLKYIQQLEQRIATLEERLSNN